MKNSVSDDKVARSALPARELERVSGGMLDVMGGGGSEGNNIMYCPECKDQVPVMYGMDGRIYCQLRGHKISSKNKFI